MKRAAILLTLAILLLLTSITLAQSGNGYDLSWWTVDDGGGHSEGQGGYTLYGTVGQPDAGALEGGEYSLSGGFWAGGGTVEHRVYLPLVLNNH